MSHADGKISENGRMELDTPEKMIKEFFPADSTGMEATYILDSGIVKRDFTQVRPLGSGSYGKTTLLKNDKGELFVRKRVDISKLTQMERWLCLNEIKIISNLSHPFIVEYIGSYMEDHHMCIITRYCKGGDLHRYIAKKREANEPISEERILKWTCQMLSALRFLHKRHILHRDLKSLNVLIDSDKRVRLCDFGVSKSMNATGDYANTMIGTPYYFSPELIRGNRYNWPSDIWALGCLVYELATYRTPFDGAKGMHHLFRLIKSRPIPSLPPRFSAQFNTLYKSMMMHDSRFRASAADLLATDLFQVLKQMLAEAQGKTGTCYHSVSDTDTNDTHVWP